MGGGCLMETEFRFGEGEELSGNGGWRRWHNIVKLFNELLVNYTLQYSLKGQLYILSEIKKDLR